MRRVLLIGHPGSGVSTLRRRWDLAARLGDAEWQALAFEAGPRPDSDVAGSVDAHRPAVAVLVISCTQGAGPELGVAFEALAERSVPVVIALTHADSPDADIEEMTAIAARILGPDANVSCDQLPVLGEDLRPIGFISLIDGTITEWSSGEIAWHEPEPQHLEMIEDSSAEFLESVLLAAPEDLFAAWQSDESLDANDIGSEFVEQVRAGLRHPVVAVGMHPRGLGDSLALDLLAAVTDVEDLG